MKILDGVIDVGMRSGEMRRILAHDPAVASALETIGREQDSIRGTDDTIKSAGPSSTPIAAPTHTSVV